MPILHSTLLQISFISADLMFAVNLELRFNPIQADLSKRTKLNWGPLLFPIESSKVLPNGEDFVKRIEAAHRLYTTEPIVSGNHFTVGREIDITVQGLGSIHINQIMLYEVKNGQIVLEQFFY